MPYLGGLDGLRAIAVVAVIAYHGLDAGLPAGFSPEGGFLGVEVFFVISGYLITALLVAEHERSGRIDLVAFWRRRARRLLPALFLLLGGATVLALAFADDALDTLRTEVPAALLYVTNWFLITSDQSYFEAAGRPSLLQHLWSLAIEEQFYLLWPIVVVAALRLVGRRGLLAATLLGVAASTWQLWTLFGQVERYGDVSGVYYRTDARAAALLIGAAAALCWRPWERAATQPLGRAVRLVVASAGAVGLAVVVAAQYWFTNDVIRWERIEQLYRGGFLATSVATVLIIAAVAVPGSASGRLLGWAPLRWIGRRSYGLYLWHWPVFQLTRPRVDVDLGGWDLTVLRLALTLVLAECSFRCIEEPIRQRRLVPAVRGLMRSPVLVVRGVGGAALLAAVVFVAIAGPALDRSGYQPVATAAAASLDEPGPDTVPIGAVVEPAATPTAAPQPTAPVAPTPPPTVPAPPTSTAVALPADFQLALPTPVPTATAVPAPTPTPVPLMPPARLTVFGDSVALGAERELETLAPEVQVDARVGRQWWEAAEEIVAYAEEEELGEVVVVHLGNNGPVDARLFDEVMLAIGDEPVVVFVNVSVPRTWESEANEVIAEGVDRWSEQAVLVDWHEVAVDQPGWFAEDGVHLERDGRVALAEMIEPAILEPVE